MSENITIRIAGREGRGSSECETAMLEVRFHNSYHVVCVCMHVGRAWGGELLLHDAEG